MMEIQLRDSMPDEPTAPRAEGPKLLDRARIKSEMSDEGGQFDIKALSDKMRR